MEPENTTTSKDDGLVEELDHKADTNSDFSDDETDDQWGLASVSTWFSAAQKSTKTGVEIQAPRPKGSSTCDDESVMMLLSSLSPITRPEIDPGDSAPLEDDLSVSNLSVSSLIRGLAFEVKSSIVSTAPKNNMETIRHPKGEIKSLLGAATHESLDDGYDSPLSFVDANNANNFDGFFLERRPDPPGSLSSRSDHDGAQMMAPPNHKGAASDSSDANSASYCDAFQSQLDRRLKGSFLSDELNLFMQRNPGSNDNLPHTIIPPPKQQTLSDKTSSTLLDTTSDSTIEKNNVWAVGYDKVEELTKRPCYCRKKVLLLGLVFLIIVIVSAAVSASTSTTVDMLLIEAETEAPTEAPTTAEPSSVPSDMPSLSPSHIPTNSMVPSSAPSSNPSSSPSQNPSYLEMETIFYAVGDVPYHGLEKIQLGDRMRELPSDGEFVIHVGDIRRAGNSDGQPCRIETYQEVHNILLKSDIPVFIIPGDNEWNDCPNPSDAKRFWRSTFSEFDKNWNHTFEVYRNPVEPENFFFVHKRTLYFGLNILGGRVRDRTRFNNDLREKFEFVKEMVDQHVVAGDAVNVVIFGHAFPVPHHYPFFDPLRDYIHTRLENKVPILYLNGDYHFYEFEKEYLGFSNFNRLQVAQGTAFPPLKVAVTASNSPSWNATEAFAHDRMLWLRLPEN